MPCKVCGNPAKQCCKMSKAIGKDVFAAKYFPDAVFGPMPAPGSPEYARWVPYSTVREFYDDYLTSGLSFKQYVQQTTKQEA